ncbi:MFS transporter [Undibacterium seohonense]|uniref:MFS transporter n=1 Tax=Undibacterium seohonense TaxID=1344950 RepID=A0ABR6X301_9BURK|nr:MFS transporter [Undibacterium seohonense]MBC3807335.1 MFS transporter [Undibacterium seohonense]
MTTIKRNPFHRAFYVANTMEIFERLAWYGFFTLSSLYITSPTAQGGLGFSDQERGFLQGMIPFLLYLLPVITGALADRFGYRRMFLISFAIMCPSYYMLGQVHSFWAFFMVFLAVAVGAACFKPVVVGTIGRSTDDTNRGLGFGVFYTMVNIGGFIGPFIAGYVRAVSWDLVFVMSAIWIGINFIPALFFYKEPEHDASKDQRSLKLVLLEAQEVLGNGRLALMVVPAIIALMVTTRMGIGFHYYLMGVAAWVALNFAWTALIKNSQSSAWYMQKVEVGNIPFVLYLLILTGFWVVYFQLFTTLPVFIRDFVDTKDLVLALQQFAPSSVEFLAGVNLEQLSGALPALAQKYHAGMDAVALKQLAFDLVNYKVMVPDEVLRTGLLAIQQGSVLPAALAEQWATQYRQVNPEYIINVGFGLIVLCQIAISAYIQRWRALPILVFGTVVLSAGIALCGLGASVSAGLAIGGTTVVMAVVVFSIGEMIASPKSQEYVAAIAPKSKTAMYMGYYFVSMALGNLFAGLLSGWAYTAIAKDMNRPLLMWLLFAAIGVMTAIALLIFNTWLKRR